MEKVKIKKKGIRGKEKEEEKGKIDREEKRKKGG